MVRALRFVWYFFCALVTSPYMHWIAFGVGALVLLELLLPVNNSGWWHWLRNPVIGLGALVSAHTGTIIIHGHTVHSDD